jgi:hypothetical protein
MIPSRQLLQPGRGGKVEDDPHRLVWYTVSSFAIIKNNIFRNSIDASCKFAMKFRELLLLSTKWKPLLLNIPGGPFSWPYDLTNLNTDCDFHCSMSRNIS